MLPTQTLTPTVPFVYFFKHWGNVSSRKFLSQINQGFLHCFIPMQHHSGLHAKIHREHRAIDFCELGKVMQILAKEVTI